MKVLYIGGTGEISYECVLASVREGHDVTVFNRGRNDEPLPSQVRRIAGELADESVYAALGEGRFDVVCQFLAYDISGIERDLRIFGGKVGQYVFISSASAYQKPPRHYLITERTPLANPYWPYSQAKADMERRLFEWHGEGRLPVTVVRPSHTYRRRFPGTFVKGDEWAWRMVRGRAVISHGDGTSLWTITHSSDFARPFVRLLGNEAALGEAFHITAERAYAWDDILRAVGEAIGVKPEIVHVPTATLLRWNAEWTGPLLGDKAWSVVFDNSKVRRVAGDSECRIGLAEGMRRVAEHWKRRAEAFQPDSARQELLDRIAKEQERVGPSHV